MKNANCLFRCLWVAGLFLGILLPAGAAPQPQRAAQGRQAADGGAILNEQAHAKIEPLLFKELEARSGRTDFFVWLADKADLSPADGLPTKEAKGRFVLSRPNYNEQLCLMTTAAWIYPQRRITRLLPVLNMCITNGGTHSTSKGIIRAGSNVSLV